MSYFTESKLKKISIDSLWRECCNNWNSWSFGDPLLHHPKWIQCDLLKPIILSLSSHTIQSINNNPWCHWKDPLTSQVNKCPDIFRKCPTGSKLRIAYKIQGKLITPLEPPHRDWSFCQKCRWQVTPRHAYTLGPTKSEWVDCYPGIVWETIRKRSHKHLVRECWATVASACRATVDWSWLKEWNWCALAHLHLKKCRRGLNHQKSFLQIIVCEKKKSHYQGQTLLWKKSVKSYSKSNNRTVSTKQGIY